MFGRTNIRPVKNGLNGAEVAQLATYTPAPSHTEESLEMVHPATNFTIQSLAASLVK